MAGFADFMSSAGGGAAIGAGAALLGRSKGRSSKWLRRQSQWGMQDENIYYRQREQQNWNVAQQRGLTPQEYYGSPAPGASGPTGSTGVALGNQQNQKDIADQQQRTQAISQGAQAAVALQQTKMQTESNERIAGVRAGTETRGQDIQAAIAQGRLDLDRDSYNLNVKKISAQLELTSQQIKKAINEVATSTPKFQTYMKQLSMGADNMLVEYFQRHHGINLSDPSSFTSLTYEKREELIAAIVSLSSGTYKNIQGAKESLGLGGTGLFDVIGKGIEGVKGITEGQTLGKPPKNSNRRGHGARM